MKIVASMDTGVDDALALAYLLAHATSGQAATDKMDTPIGSRAHCAKHTGCELLGVLATYGNVEAHTAARNTRYVLDLFGHSDIPVIQSSACPSWADMFIPDAGCAQFHGPDGLGGCFPRSISARMTNMDETTAQHGLANRKHQPDGVVSIGGYRPGDPHANPAATAPTLANVPEGNAPAARPRQAIEFLIQQVRRHGRSLTVLATGPLTDIDAALRLAPDIASKLKLVMMGGSLTQPGNCWDAVAETNMIQDPEAADRVMHSGADITMIGLDVTHQCLLGSSSTTLWKRHAAQTGLAESAKRLTFLANIADFSIRANLHSDPTLFANGMPLHDPLAAAVALDPTLVSTFDTALQVETSTGDFTGVRGRTTGDPEGLINPQAPRVHVALTVDSRRFVQEFTDDIIF